MRQSEIISRMNKGPKSTHAVMKKFCGKLIAHGTYRNVYEFKLDTRFVVKIERDMRRGQFANAMEWRNWIDNKYWLNFSQWLAPCLTISESGRVLIQQKVEFRDRKDYPKEIPNMFTDTKIENFGWIKDKFVCCDYTYINYLAVTPSSTVALKKARWWSVKGK